MLAAIIAFGWLVTVVLYERRSVRIAREFSALTHATAAPTKRAIAEIERVCQPVYLDERSARIAKYTLDIPGMRYEAFSSYGSIGHVHLYALSRLTSGKWRARLLEVQMLGEQYDEKTGKLMDGTRFRPQAWVDREYPLDDPYVEGEIETAYRLEERAEHLEWIALPENLVAWAETSYQRCLEFFKEHKGWTPQTMERELPTTSEAMWAPPQTYDEGEIQESFDRMGQARQRTLEAKRALNRLTNELLKEHAQKSAAIKCDS